MAKMIEWSTRLHVKWIERWRRTTNVRIKETIVLSICCWLFWLPISIYRFEVVISSFRFVSFHSMFDVIFSLFSSNIDDNVAIFHWTNSQLRRVNWKILYMTDKSQWMCYFSDVFKSNAVKLSHTTTVCFLSCFNRSFVRHTFFFAHHCLLSHSLFQLIEHLLTAFFIFRWNAWTNHI